MYSQTHNQQNSRKRAWEQTFNWWMANLERTKKGSGIWEQRGAHKPSRWISKTYRKPGMAGRENRGQESKHCVRQCEWHSGILLLLLTTLFISQTSLFQDLSSPGTVFLWLIVPEVKKWVSLLWKSSLHLLSCLQVGVSAPVSVSIHRLGYAFQYACLIPKCGLE